MTIPLLDHLTVEIERRIGHASITVYSGLVVIPSKMVSLAYNNVNWREKFSLFADLFKDDFPCPKALETELDLWKLYWLESKDCLPDNISRTLKRIPFHGFNNNKVSLTIVLAFVNCHSLLFSFMLCWDIFFVNIHSFFMRVCFFMKRQLIPIGRNYYFGAKIHIQFHIYLSFYVYHMT